MVSSPEAQAAPVARRIEEVSGIRPVTLLIASGILLIIAILMTTGIAANHLRQQALDSTESELGRIDSVLATASNRTFHMADTELTGLADSLAQAGIGNPATPPDAITAPAITGMLSREIGPFPHFQAVALVSADGQILNRAGAWPSVHDLRQDLAAPLPEHVSGIGNPVGDPRTETVSVPLLRRVGAASGSAPVTVVALVPVTEFIGLFAAVPLAQDGVIELLRRDGTLLARYPAQLGAGTLVAARPDLDPVFGDVRATMVRHVTAEDGDWRIETLRALANYPVAISISRSADQALAGWTHQGLWFGGFAVIGSLGIGFMVFLIARQFKAHAAIAAIRAQNFDIERARMAAEAELLKSERLSVLGQLTATVAHELRNPLSAIRNTLFTMKELVKGAGIKVDRPIARMERSIERCDRIISDLLEYTRHRALNLSRVNFDRWLAEVLAEQTMQPDVTLVTEMGAADTVAALDSDRFRRVFINLVENAGQALGEVPAEQEKRITVRTRAVDADLVIEIEDTGPGIPPENLARIFEPLFSTKSFGTGLGLPTVKQIVAQHEGTISLTSEVGRGTCVTVRLPLNAAKVESVRVAA
jgi:signal transduction histidine kinase